MREIVSQTRYQRSWHPTKFNPSRCDALLCAGLAFGGYAKPVLEQVLRSIRKNAAEPTETVKGSGNGRCAHRRINHTRAESRPGRDPADAERFSGSKISAIKFAPLCKCKKCNEFTLSKKRRFVLVNYRKQRNTRNATELTFLEISPKPTTTSALPVPGPTRPFPCNRARFNTQFVCGVFRVPVIRGVSGNSYTNI